MYTQRSVGIVNFKAGKANDFVARNRNTTRPSINPTGEMQAANPAMSIREKLGMSRWFNKNVEMFNIQKHFAQKSFYNSLKCL